MIKKIRHWKYFNLPICYSTTRHSSSITFFREANYKVGILFFVGLLFCLLVILFCSNFFTSPNFILSSAPRGRVLNPLALPQPLDLNLMITWRFPLRTIIRRWRFCMNLFERICRFMDSRDHVWQRVWKMTFLVWNRVWIGRRKIWEFEMDLKNFFVCALN